MLNTKAVYPWWVTEPDDIAAILASCKRGTVHTLCQSAGGREIPYITYGEKEDYNRQANYSSALGARHPKYYADREGKRKTILIFAATHGQETEGICAIANLLTLLETGVDLRGEAVPMITEAFDALNPRLIIVPIFNMDGRCRCPADSMLGEPHDADGYGLRYWGQGTWKEDGSLCGWPDCMKVHPIKDASDYLGAYFNDDGVNLHQDTFFAPMAEETRAMMKLVDEEAPECVVTLHGGSNSTNFFIQPKYVSQEAKESIHRLAMATAALEAGYGYKTYVEPVQIGDPEFPPPSFNLTSAIHHICGAAAATYESNEGMCEPNCFGAEEILIRHYCLFTALFNCGWEKKEAL